MPAEAGAKQSAEAKPPAIAKEKQPAIAAPPVLVARKWATLGSMAPDSPYRLLVTLQNRGAAVERIELVQRTAKGQLRFLDLEQKSGYWEHLA
jgi:YidC/Oxa1 family membrane protein insertase